MSTPAIIAYCGDESTAYIYCGHDGDYGYVGRLLLSHYNTRQLAHELVAKGNITGLGTALANTSSYADLATDPAEKEDEATLHVESLEAMMNAIHKGYGTMNYIYVWDRVMSCWMTATGLSYHQPQWTSLAKVLERIDMVADMEQKLDSYRKGTAIPEPPTTTELFEALKARLVNEAKALPYPDPSGEGRQRARVLAHLEDAWAIMNTYVYQGDTPDASK